MAKVTVAVIKNTRVERVSTPVSTSYVVVSGKYVQDCGSSLALAMKTATNLSKVVV